MKTLVIFLFSVIASPTFAGDAPGTKNNATERLEKRVVNLEKGVNRLMWLGTGWSITIVSAGFLVTADTLAEAVIGGMGINTGFVMGIAACYFSFKNLSLKTD